MRRKLRKPLAILLAFAMMFCLVPAMGFAADDGDNSVKRLSGQNRYETAANIAEDAFPDGAGAVVIANGEPALDYADALAGSFLAGAADAPILLTNAAQLPDATAKAIEKLGATKAYVLGGELAVSNAVVSQLEKLLDEVERVEGQNRFETAVNISKVGKNLPGAEININTALIANGTRPADALAAGAYANAQGIPVLLVNQNNIPAATKAALAGIENTFVIGGNLVVSDDVASELDATRISGRTRNATSVAVAETLWESPENFALVNGADGIVDALAGSVLGMPILYVPSEDVDAYLNKVITGNSFGFILGGVNRISDEFLNEVQQMIEGVEEELQVESVSAIDANNILVTFEGVEEAVEIELDEALVHGQTEVTFVYEEVEYTAELDEAYVDPAVVEAEELAAAKETAKAELDEYVDATEYETNAEDLTAALAEGKEAIDAAETTEEVDAAVVAAKEAIDAIETDAQIAEREAEEALAAAKETAKAELDEYVDATEYETNAEDLTAALAEGKEAIDAAETTEEVDAAVVAAKEAIDAIETDAQIAEREAEELAAALAAYEEALAAVEEEDYTADSWAAYQEVVEASVVTEENTVEEINAATAAILEAQENLETELEAARRAADEAVSAYEESLLNVDREAANEAIKALKETDGFTNAEVGALEDRIAAVDKQVTSIVKVVNEAKTQFALEEALQQEPFVGYNRNNINAYEDALGEVVREFETIDAIQEKISVVNILEADEEDLIEVLDAAGIEELNEDLVEAYVLALEELGDTSTLELVQQKIDNVNEEARVSQLIFDINRINGEGNMVEKLAELENEAFDALTDQQKEEVALLFIINRGETSEDTPTEEVVREGYHTISGINWRLNRDINTYNALLNAVNDAGTYGDTRAALNEIGEFFDVIVNQVEWEAVYRNKGEGYQSVAEILVVLEGAEEAAVAAAEAAVAAAEEEPSQEAVNEAQALVNKLPGSIDEEAEDYNDVKAELQDRIDAVQASLDAATLEAFKLRTIELFEGNIRSNENFTVNAEEYAAAIEAGIDAINAATTEVEAFNARITAQRVITEIDSDEDLVEIAQNLANGLSQAQINAYTVNKASVTAARQAYYVLTPELQAEVAPTAVAKLEAAERALAGLVKDAGELKAALTGTVETIVFEDNIKADEIKINREGVTIDGADFTLTADNTVLINSNDVTLKNLTVDRDMNDPSKWVSKNAFAIQAYKVTGIELENVTMTNANAGLIVNGSEVNVINSASVNNAFGGIEVSQGEGVEETPKLTVDGFTHDGEETPAIWIDGLDHNGYFWVVAPGFEGEAYYEYNEDEGVTKTQYWFTAV
jgi:putative cell wall-binding protein